MPLSVWIARSATVWYKSAYLAATPSTNRYAPGLPERGGLSLAFAYLLLNFFWRESVRFPRPFASFVHECSLNNTTYSRMDKLHLHWCRGGKIGGIMLYTNLSQDNWIQRKVEFKFAICDKIGLFSSLWFSNSNSRVISALQTSHSSCSALVNLSFCPKLLFERFLFGSMMSLSS